MTRRSPFSVCAAALIAFPHIGRAQDSDPHHWALVPTAGFTALPGAFQWSCGNSGNGGSALSFELGGAALYRLRRWIVLQADTRYNKQIMRSGCTAILLSADTTYDGGLSRFGFATSTFRVGVETPPTLPMVLLRAMVGAGFTWSNPLLPVTAWSVGLGAHNRGVRFLAEWERMQTRAHATARTYQPVGYGPWPETRITTHPTWYSLRFGLEVPLRPAPNAPAAEGR